MAGRPRVRGRKACLVAYIRKNIRLTKIYSVPKTCSYKNLSDEKLFVSGQENATGGRGGRAVPRKGSRGSLRGDASPAPSVYLLARQEKNS